MAKTKKKLSVKHACEKHSKRALKLKTTVSKKKVQARKPVRAKKPQVRKPEKIVFNPRAKKFKLIGKTVTAQKIKQAKTHSQLLPSFEPIKEAAKFEHASTREDVLSSLKDIAAKSLLLEVGGENALKVVEGIADPTSAEELAKTMGLKVSGVRVVLNKLHSQGLVEYAKVRGGDTGWYYYVWTFRVPELQALIQEKDKCVKLLEASVPDAVVGKEELKNLFACPKCNTRVKFEDAMDLRFKCGDCGKTLKNLNGTH
ncbi:hypothetical protein HY992_05835 [Candidatus Micrarchaeota archaeon]|nr:hypothetical protein [Candidatus Micrarchaeota archaeon]